MVIAIIGILMSLLMPALSVAKQRARKVKCISNVKQQALAFHLFAGDNKDQLPPLNSGGPFKDPVTPHSPTNWWYRIISDGGYLPSVTNKGGIWRCPNVRDDDIDSPFGERMEGYGPVENHKHVPGMRSLLNYALDSGGKPAGSDYLGSIRRSSELWLVGDVGVPKNEDLDLGKYPYGGYYRTDITTFPPDALGIWNGLPPKQPAFRHKLLSNIGFVDGHVESWDYADLSTNRLDIFGLKSH